MSKVTILILCLLLIVCGLASYDLERQKVGYRTRAEYFESELNRVVNEYSASTEKGKLEIAGLKDTLVLQDTEIARLKRLPPIIKEIIVSRPVTFKRFTREGLTEWLLKYNFKSYDGVEFGKIDCDDFAESMQIQAYYDGYLLSVQLVNNIRHMGNLVILEDGDIYYIESSNSPPTVQFMATRD